MYTARRKHLSARPRKVMTYHRDVPLPLLPLSGMIRL
jgi:hypothetical protein